MNILQDFKNQTSHKEYKVNIPHYLYWFQHIQHEQNKESRYEHLRCVSDSHHRQTQSPKAELNARLP